MKIINRNNFKLWIIFGVSLLVAAISYRYLPEKIPGHFDMYGNVNRYDSKIMIFLMPFIIFIMNIMADILRKIDPKKRSYSKFTKQYYLVFFAVSLLLLGLQLYIIAFSLDINVVNISTIMPLIIGILFTIIGNAMPKFKQNFYAGIRTSWTLSDEEVWFKTHRLGGKVWFIGGILMMVSSIMPANIQFIFICLVAAALVLIPIIYSYIVYRDKFRN